MKKQLIVMLMMMGHICILMSSSGSSGFSEFQITTDEYDQQYPEIYGNFIIWDHKTDEVISVHGYNENNYRRALGSFQLAKRRYQNIDSEKVSECEEWIEKCEEEILPLLS